MKMRAEVKAHVHPRDERIDIVPGSAGRRVHPGYIHDGKPYVDPPTCWLTLRVSALEVVLYSTPAEARALAAELLAAANQIDAEPTPCRGCGYGCPTVEGTEKIAEVSRG